MYAAIARVTQFDITDNKDDKGVTVCEPMDFELLGEGEYAVDSPRKLLAELRDNEFLSEYSKGKVAVRDHGDHVVIIDKNKGHPLFVLFHRDNAPDLPIYHKSFAKMVNESLTETLYKLEAWEQKQARKANGPDDEPYDSEWN